MPEKDSAPPFCVQVCLLFVYIVLYLQALVFESFNYMKRILLAFAFLAMLTGCAQKNSAEKEENALEAGVGIYQQAIEEVHKAKSEDELALIVEKTYNRIDSIGVSDEIESCLALLNSGDSVALKEREPQMRALLEAADEYMDAVAVAVARLAENNP